MVCLAASGVRRATEAAKQNPARNSSELVIALFNNRLIHSDAEFLPRHIDSRYHIFVDRFGRQAEFFAEDIQQTIAANEAHQMITAAIRLRQGMLWRLGSSWQTELLILLGQCQLGRTTLQFRIAI